MTEMSVLVPPTSTNTPSAMPRWTTAAATPAAGPERIVRTGRIDTSSAVITPPSERTIINGAQMPRARTAESVASTADIIFGRIEPLMTEVLVRALRP